MSAGADGYRSREVPRRSAAAGGGGGGFGEGGAEEGVERGKERPGADVGGGGGGGGVKVGGFGFFDLVLLFEGVDAVFTLDIGAERLGGGGGGVTGVDGGSDFLPVALAEVAAVEVQVTVTPRLDQCVGRVLAPTVLA